MSVFSPSLAACHMRKVKRREEKAR